MSRFLEGPVLGLETSGHLTGAALCLAGRLAGEFSVDHRAGSAEVLLDLVGRLLREHGLRPRDLLRVGVAIGPGSFTGLRVGLAAGRSIAYGAGIAAVGVPSHEALSWPWMELQKTIVLMTGLRRGGVFLEIGRWLGDDWRLELSVRTLSVTLACDEVERFAGAGDLLFLGESVEAVRALEPRISHLGHFVTGPLDAVRRPAPVAFLAARPAAREYLGDDLVRLEPLYLRGADARRPSSVAGGGDHHA